MPKTTNNKRTIIMALLYLELSAVVSKVWQNVKKIMGFSPECLHGGQKNLRGDCVCPKHFKGDLCETIVCLNNGTRERGPVPAFSYYVNPAEEEFCRYISRSVSFHFC